MPFIVDRPSRPKPELRLNLGDKNDRARFFKVIERPVNKELSQIRVKNYKGRLSDSLNLASAPIEKNAGYRAQNIVRGHQPLPSQRLQRLLGALPRLDTDTAGPSFRMQGLLDALPSLDTDQQSQTTTSSDESDEPDCYFSLGDGWEHYVTPPAPAPVPVPAPAPIPAQPPIAPPAQSDNLVDAGSNVAGWIDTPDLVRVKPIRPTSTSTAFDWFSVLNREFNLLHRDMYRFDQIKERNDLLLQRQRPADRNARLSRFAAYFASMQREERILLNVESSMRGTHVEIVINPDYQEWRMRTTRNKLERAIYERLRRVEWARGYLDTVDLTTDSIW